MFEIAERGAIGNFYLLEIYGIVKRCLEFVGLKVEGVHHLLGVAHSEGRLRGL